MKISKTVVGYRADMSQSELDFITALVGETSSTATGCNFFGELFEFCTGTWVVSDRRLDNNNPIQMARRM